MKNSYIDHIAIETENVAESVSWYRRKFKCDIKYQDQSIGRLSLQHIDQLDHAEEHSIQININIPF